MFEAVTETRSRWRIFWPEVTDLAGAAEAITLGYRACFVLAGLKVVVAALGAKAAILDAIAFAVLGFALRRKSRTAAVMAVGLMSATIVISLSRMPLFGVLDIILFVCLLSSMRGTFAYKKLTRAHTRSASQPHPGMGD